MRDRFPYKHSLIIFTILLSLPVIAASLIDSDGIEHDFREISTGEYNIFLMVKTDTLLENLESLKKLSGWGGSSINLILFIPKSDRETLVKVREIVPPTITPYTGTISPEVIPEDFEETALAITDKTGTVLYKSIPDEFPETIEELLVDAELPLPRIPSLEKGKKLPIFSITGVDGLMDTGNLLKRGPLIIFISDLKDDRLMDNLQRVQFLYDDLSDEYGFLFLIRTEEVGVLKKLKESLNLTINLGMLTTIVEESYVGTEQLPILISTNDAGIVTYISTGAFPPTSEEVKNLVYRDTQVRDTIDIEILSDEAIVSNLRSSWIPTSTFIDEGKIIYSAISDETGSDELFTYDLETGDIEGITYSHLPDLHPRMIDKSCIFFSLRSENEDIWSLNLNTLEMIQITDTLSYDEYPSISPLGDEIAFQSDTNGNFDIWVCGAFGRNLKYITTHHTPDVHPSYCPDGSGRIAFVSMRSGNPDIFIIRRDREDLSQITFNESSDLFPQWTPDGTRIAFSSNREGDYDIYLISDDSSSIVRLTEEEGDEFPTCWNIKGNMLLYTKMTGEELYEIHLLKIEEQIKEEELVEKEVLGVEYE